MTVLPDSPQVPQKQINRIALRAGKGIYGFCCANCRYCAPWRPSESEAKIDEAEHACEPDR